MPMPDAPPAVSVLMVNWNTREMTLACLRSLYAETRQTSFEVILVDNDSSDGSVGAIRAEFPQVNLIAERTNHGFAKATNMAAERARGRFLLMLNTDTVVLDGAVDKLCNFAGEYPEARIWGGRTLFGDGSLNPTSCWGKPSLWSIFCFATGLSRAFSRSGLFNPEGYGGWKRDSVREVDIVTGCLFLIERDFWRALDGFDPAFFMYGEEADLCARARASGARPIITPAATIVHYGGASAASRADKIIYLFGSRMGLLERQFSPASRWTARKLTLLSVWTRAFAYGLVAHLGIGSQFNRSAMEWKEAWRQRSQWRGGPLCESVRRGGVGL